MSNYHASNTISPNEKRNVDATKNDTPKAQLERNSAQLTDLQALSAMVLERNSKGNLSQLKKSCAVALPKQRNRATFEELQGLIRQVSQTYGGDDSAFLSDYSNDVIKAYENNLHPALLCFRDLAVHKPSSLKKEQSL